MVVLHLPRFHFSILTPPPSLFLRPHSIPLANNPKFPTKSFLFSALKSTLTTSEPIPISHALSPEETHVELSLEKLFVPPETDVPVDSASLSARILKGSNIVVSKYASESQVLQADFVKSSVRTEDCPSDGLPEFALVGRSNVGKSSLLNSLVRRKKLALTSKKPGKTQCINHFRINDSWYMVDLPGYGYAAAPQELRMDWENFTKDYFLNRSTLVSVFLLIDASIPAKQIDLDYACWLGQNQVEWKHVSPLLNKWIRRCISGWTNCALKPLDVDESPLLKIPMTLIFTKCDKRKKKKNGGKRPEENVNDFQELIRGFFETVPPWIMTSSVTNQGRDEILLHMAQLRNYWLKHLFR